MTQWTLDAATDRAEVTSFGDANKTYVQGLKDLSGSFSGLFNDTDTTVFTGADSTDGVKIYLYPSTDAATIYWYGPAWIDYSVDTSVTDAVKVSGSFAANGSWAKKP